MATKKNIPLSVETLKHEDATRKNIPTAEYQSVMKQEQQSLFLSAIHENAKTATETWTRN